MNCNPLISVVIPNYNCEHLIVDTIDSVLAQTYTEYEIIIVDNSSPDETKKFLEPYLERIDYRVREERGLSVARNKGLSLAKGKYVIFLDPGDILLPHILEQQVTLLNNNSDLGFVICGWQLQDETKKITSNVELWKQIPQLNIKTWLEWRFSLPSTTLFCRHWLEKVSGFPNINPFTDYIDCLLQMIALGCQSDWVETIGVCYLQKKETITQNLTLEKVAFARLYDRFFGRLDLVAKIRQLENSTRFNFLVWIAWRYYQTKNFTATIRYLQKSLQYTILSPVETINSWLDLFENWWLAKYSHKFDAYSLTSIRGWNELIAIALNNKIPQISVIIFTHNAQKYLEEALASVFAQTYTDYEIIVVDDRSEDRTEGILTNYSDRLRYIQQPQNLGIAASKNRGLYLARGQFITFLAADNLFLLHKLARQIAIFHTSPQIGIVNSGFRQIDDAGNSLIDIKWWEEIVELDREAWLVSQPITFSTMMFRRSWLLKVDGFNPAFSTIEDIDLVFRLVAEGCQAKWLSEITTCCRSSCHCQDRSEIVTRGEKIEIMLDKFFSQPNLPDSIKNLESKSRYQSLVEMAWLFYRAGYIGEMTAYLSKSIAHTNYDWAELISNWIDLFANYARRSGKTLNIQTLIASSQWQQLCSEIRGLTRVSRTSILLGKVMSNE